MNVLLPIIIALFLFAVPVSAQEKPPRGALEVMPAFVEVTLDKAGQVVDVPITYTNHSDNYVSLEVFPIDFKQKDESGSIGFLGQEAGSYSFSLSSFLSLESQSIELAPKEKKTFIVSVRDRTDLSPGGHYAAIVARMVPGQEFENTAVAPSVSSLILLRKVGGERFHLIVKDSSWPDMSVGFSFPQKMTLLFQNEGNIHMVPYGRIEIRDLLGRVVYDGMINPSSLKVLPLSRRYIEAPITKLQTPLPIMFHSVSVRGYDSLKKTNFVLEESFIYINPVFVLVLIIAVLFLFMRRRRGKPVRSEGMEQIQVSTPEKRKKRKA